MRKLLIGLLIFIIAFTAGSQRTQQACANPAVLAAPEIAIGLLILASAAVAAAHSEGAITDEQSLSWQTEIREDKETLQAAVRQGVETTLSAAKVALEGVLSVQAVLHSSTICSPLISSYLKTAVSQSSSSKKTEAAREATEGECRPGARRSPFTCCSDFMKKFKKGNKMTQVGENAFRIWYYHGLGILRQCCFEWDSLHGRFEVFETSNHKPYKHKGEKACAREEDLSEDICDATYADKADFISDRHAPRNGCP